MIISNYVPNLFYKYGNQECNACIRAETLIYIILYFTLVTSETHFAMPFTRLIGLTQPGVVTLLIKLPSNAEKGMMHQFMWVYPSPLFRKFSILGEVKDFQQTMG